MTPNPNRRQLLFAMALLALTAAYWKPLAQLIGFISVHEHYSHIPLIPLVSGYLLLLDRKRILTRAAYDWKRGLALILAGGVVISLGMAAGNSLTENDLLSAIMFSFFLFGLGAFVWLFGPSSFRVGRFALLFLILAVPIPDFALNAAVHFLQYRSADATGMLFNMIRVPVFRDGIDFYLAGLTIRVAEECSGIRSSLALFITGLLAANLFLRSGWSRAALLLVVVPLAVLKNGIRIVGLTLLTIYVDPGFLHGDLHTRGGFVFFLIALLLLGLVLWILRRVEGRLLPPPAVGQGRDEASPGGESHSRAPLRACMVTYSFYDADNRVIRYAETLAGRGDHVEVISLRSFSEQAHSVLRGVHVSRIQRRVRDETSRRSYLFKIMLFFFRSMWLVTLRHFWNPYDFIHIHSMPDFLIFVAWFPKLTGAKITLDIHDLLPEMYADKFSRSNGGKVIRILLCEERWSCRFADHVIAANHLWAKRLTTRSVPPSKCTPILNYPDRTIFTLGGPRTPKERFIFVYPGSLGWHQGLDVAVEAMGKIAGQAPQVEFHIYGDGPERASLQALVSKLGLGGRVFLKEPLPILEIPKVMRDADVGVVPKRHDSFGDEAFSTKILEFMSVGVPVIVADTTIDRYYFNDSVVRFFPSGDANSLAEAMLQLVHDEAERARLAQNALQFVESFDWKVKKEQYLSLVDSLVMGERIGSSRCVQTSGGHTPRTKGGTR